MNNNQNLNLAQKLKNNIKSNAQISLVCEKFSMRTFHFLYDQLKDIDNMKILLLNNSSYNSNNESENKLTYKNNFFISEKEIKKNDDLLMPFISKLFYKLIEQKRIEFKTFKNNLINSSSLIIRNADGNYISYYNFNSLDSEIIGLENNHFQNAFILEMKDNEQSKYFLSIFQNYWFSSEVEDINEEVKTSLKTMFDDLTCYTVYHLSLCHIFKDNMQQINQIEEKQSTAFENTLIYQKLYDFQKNAVYGLIDKIEKFNGCILADSVGLGKTFEALAVIKFYELKRQRVLVLVPKKLKDNWTLFIRNSSLNPFINERFQYDVKSHTDINRTKGKSGDDDLRTFVWSDYDLVVIDESHNFRNFRWNDEEDGKKSRYQLVMEKIISSGRNTKVLLLTATPVNNRMQDINNQIKFITNNNDSALEEYGISSIAYVCKEAELNSNRWAKLQESEKNSRTFDEFIGPKFKKLLNLLSIARSRKQIRDNYSDSNISFPNRLAPKNITWKLQKDNVGVNFVDLNNKLGTLSLAIYRPLKYVYERHLGEYMNLDYIENNVKLLHFYREVGLATLMKINLFKRLESSIHSFNQTLKMMIDKTKNLINTLQNSNSSLVLNSYDNLDNDLDDDDAENYEQDFGTIGNKTKIKINHLDVHKYLSDLKYDYQIFTEIYESSKGLGYEKDFKLQQLVNEIVEKQNKPINDNNNKKMIIFTSFADTAEYLYENLISNKILSGIKFGLVTGQINKTNHPSLQKTKLETDDLLTYFSPISKNIKAANLDETVDIDILIATDCISEGQNLQDCDCLLNYDIHWNPVRIIQRFGRVDRLESKNKNILLINFWPDIQLDEYIKLESTVKTKMEKVVHASTGDDHLLRNDDSDFENYRLKQLEQLKNEVVDLEDMKNEVAISSLTMNEYLVDLSRFLKKNKDVVSKQAPGFYALADVRTLNGFKKGVIFLLKKSVTNNEKNPVDPYYLVYCDEDGNIIFTYRDVNKILSLYKSIAHKNMDLNELLINKFDQETNYGQNMNKYKNLLNIVIKSISNENAADDFGKMFQKNAYIDSTRYNFELISYLIIS